MNRLLCFLTGGHKYHDSDLKTSQGSRFGFVRLTNHCAKCGYAYSFEINVLYQLKKDLKDRREDNEY